MGYSAMTIEQAAEELQKHLMHHHWLKGVGIGEQDHRDVIYLYVSSQQPKELRRLKQEGWMGHGIVVEKTGEIRPAVHS
jgi:hypothetical protein